MESGTRLLSRRYLCIPLFLSLGIAVCGFAVLGYQVEAGQLQQKCFDDPAFENLVAYASSGALFSFDFDCSSFRSNASAYSTCYNCNSRICKSQQRGSWCACPHPTLFSLNISPIDLMRNQQVLPLLPHLLHACRCHWSHELLPHVAAGIPPALFLCAQHRGNFKEEVYCFQSCTVT